MGWGTQALLSPGGIVESPWAVGVRTRPGACHLLTLLAPWSSGTHLTQVLPECSHPTLEPEVTTASPLGPIRPRTCLYHTQPAMS